jgi:hypothetical protein
MELRTTSKLWITMNHHSKQWMKALYIMVRHLEKGFLYTMMVWHDSIHDRLFFDNRHHCRCCDDSAPSRNVCSVTLTHFQNINFCRMSLYPTRCPSLDLLLLCARLLLRTSQSLICRDATVASLCKSKLLAHGTSTASSADLILSKSPHARYVQSIWYTVARSYQRCPSRPSKLEPPLKLSWCMWTHFVASNHVGIADLWSFHCRHKPKDTYRQYSHWDTTCKHY